MILLAKHWSAASLEQGGETADDQAQELRTPEEQRVGGRGRARRGTGESLESLPPSASESESTGYGAHHEGKLFGWPLWEGAIRNQKLCWGIFKTLNQNLNSAVTFTLSLKSKQYL